MEKRFNCAYCQKPTNDWPWTTEGASFYVPSCCLDCVTREKNFYYDGPLKLKAIADAPAELKAAIQYRSTSDVKMKKYLETNDVTVFERA